ncbi:hypothetical protein NBT05_11875 [Aquimarina sp. ERC-38]|uniref:hypothetical protein n=1 Tax=Aquimarina sp. ERC-38 TaxID=2949996 RepID=UPI0022483193|nr:hypothetical protein [Aquimarina sp. ERC-38]UZO79649.1 hypothetical protein NBT05_11875 [Aquimarina sp. ERC-38]
MEKFQEMLTGGHPNSLGRTVEVVDIILHDHRRIEELYQCYFSQDEVVRLRTSNAMKRICKEEKQLLLPYVESFLNEISLLNQASAQWTLAQLFLELTPDFTKEQKKKATDILKHNLIHQKDWIVLNMTIKTLGNWSKKDQKLKDWLFPQLEYLEKDKRKSVANSARKTMKLLEKH